VLSVLALLVPAGGIAYLGAVSYRDERGAVSAQKERQDQAARAIVDRIDHAIDAALDAIDRATTASADSGRGPLDPPLARYWFWIDADGRLRYPHAALAVVADNGSKLDHPTCATIEDCVRELSTSQARQGRLAQLHAAQRAEACHGDSCAANWADARRLYSQLAAFDDTGQYALLGLARLLARVGDGKAARAQLAELDRRFGDGSYDGVPVRLVTAALRAESDPAALLDVAESVVAGRYRIDPIVAVGAVARIRAKLAGELPATLVERRTALDERLAELRGEARTAAGLADDLTELGRTATPTWRGRPAVHAPDRTLVYRRRSDGGVIGVAVDARMLEDVAAKEPHDDVAVHAQAFVLPAGARPSPGLRTLAQEPFGEALPHLSLVLVNALADPDPQDEVIRTRSRRHVAFTSVLAIALGLGLLAMIRGAARARELAQLKSDFVSTVSHELKTPLTSIRMFAEMLEQGVAQGDSAKMARYHGVIVQESQRLGLLIANLLDYAQIERGTRRYSLTRQPIGELVRHAVTTFETLRDPERDGRNPIAVEVSPEAMKVEVEVDRDVVVQAVLNLLANAAKYGGADQPPKPGRPDEPQAKTSAIEITVGADATTASIAVRDHGPGIPPHEQARIFREFYRAPEAYRSGVEGTGLGLALVKRHVEALGGSVEVASTVGDGATFTIRLPRAEVVPIAPVAHGRAETPA
jgi:signal transduction histidine kinase